MSSQTMGVLVIGAGDVSSQHIHAFQQNSSTEVRAICSRTRTSCEKRIAEAKLANVGIYTDSLEALRHPGIDIVSICSPHHLHCAHAVAAAQAKKHVVLEKPIANSKQEIQQIEQAVCEARIKTVVSFVLRWNPLFKTLKEMIADHALGKVFYVETDYQHHLGAQWGSWHVGRKKTTGVSAFLVAGCHAVDALRWFAAPGEFEAAQAVEVFAMNGGYRKGMTSQWDLSTASLIEGIDPMEYEGLEVALIRFNNGVLGKVSVNFDCICPYEFPIKIFGDRGSVKNNKVWSHKFKGQTDWVEIPTICPDSGAVSHHPFQAQIDHFVDCILQDQESHCNIANARHTHDIIFGILEAYKTKALMSLQ